MDFYHEDHPDDERFDNITVEIQPRWKEGEMSGDEWRFSYLITAWRKGLPIVQYSASKLSWALSGINDAIMHTYPADGATFNSENWDKTKTLCDQPGCSNLATLFYARNKEYTDRGDELVPHDWRTTYRQFCANHQHRGDCSLDDADHNYTRIDNPS